MRRRESAARPSGRHDSPGITSGAADTGIKLPRANHRRSRKSSAPVADPQVEASKRRHAETWDERCAERDAAREEAERRKAQIQAIQAAERRRREIEDLMR